MEWICFGELTGLEKAGVIAVVVSALVFFCLGLSMFFQKELWEGRRSVIKYKEWSLGVPAPLAVAVLGLLCWLATSGGCNSISLRTIFRSGKRNGRSERCGKDCSVIPEYGLSYKEALHHFGSIRIRISLAPAWPTL
jgi:hypothetical protein